MTARGIRNNNPLNIRKGNTWRGERPVQTDKEFEEFESMEMGIRAAFKILRNYITGFGGKSPKFNTIETIVRRWAPPSENNTDAYIRAVADKVGIPAKQKVSWLNRRYMVDICHAMAEHECGVNLDRQLFESAYDMV